jgi:hypothetical protein
MEDRRFFISKLAVFALCGLIFAIACAFVIAVYGRLSESEGRSNAPAPATLQAR